MSASPQPKASVTALRFCASCAATLACWSVWIVLGTTLAALLYVAVAHELPVPGFVLRRAEAELARAGLTLKFGRARFDPSGKILLEDVQFRVSQFQEPLLTCRVLYVRRDFWSVLGGRPVPDEIRLEGATLQLPAMLSPSGTAEPLIRDLALTLRHEDRRWLVDQFNGRVGRVAVTAQGELTPPSQGTGGPPLTAAEITTRALRLGRDAARQVHYLDDFEQPALAIQLESPPGIGNTAHVLFTAASANQPAGQPLVLGPMAATGTLRLDGKEHRTLRLHAAVRHANFQATYDAHEVRAIFVVDVDPDPLAVRPREALIAAGAVSAPGIPLVGPAVRADLSRWPDVAAAATWQVSGEFIAAEVAARLREESARIHVEGRVSHELISQVLTQITPRAAPYFVFGDPVTFSAEAELGPGWKFQRLSTRVDAMRLDSRGVKITAARGKIDIEGMSFLAHDARVEMGENFARGSYWMDFATTDYRMLLDGRLRPTEINGWFRGDWWLNFWNARFAFPTEPPAAEIDLQGRWREPARTVYFGSSEVRGAKVWNGEFEHTRAVVFVRPQFAHGLVLEGTRAGGKERLAGTFKRQAEPGEHELGRFEFDFDSSVEPAVIDRMLDGKAHDILESLRFTAPPQVHAAGQVGDKIDYAFTGTVAKPLHYYGFPVDSAKVSGSVVGEDVKLDPIEFSAAGGRGTGKASVYGSGANRQLGFDLYVNDADLARTIRAVEEYQANLTGQPVTPTADSKFMKRAEGGRLNVGLSATGRPGDLTSFLGNGNAALTGTELAEIHLFGLLSQVLSGLSLNFSSLKLDEARTSFRLDGGRLDFPDLRISGRSAVIDARGNFALTTKALDFTAKFKPYEENRNLLTGVIGIVINPITSILELQLTGPISKPNWSIMVGSSSAHPETPVGKSPADPPPPPPAKVDPPKT